MSENQTTTLPGVSAEKALKASEERFSIAFNKGPMLMSISEIETGKFIEVNETFINSSGFTREEAIGSTSLDLGFITPENRDLILAELQKSGRVNNLRVEFRTKDNKPIICDYSGEIIKLEGKERLLSIGADVTEREMLESQLIQSQKMEALGSLVAGVAHEVNNPVNQFLLNLPAIKGIWRDLLPWLEKHDEELENLKFGGMKYGYVKDNLLDILESLEKSAKHVATVVQSLKRFSQKSSLLDSKKLQVNDVVVDVIEMMNTSLKKSKVSMVLNLDGSIKTIKADEQGLRQVLLNLLNNAKDATIPGNAKIEIETTMDGKTGDLVVSIKDNGSGISPELGNKVFDPFVTTKQDFGGTGLGLPVSLSIVKSMGGTIRFDSLPGVNTTFEIRLPCEGMVKKIKILLTDDDLKMRKLIRRVLETSGNYEIIEADNGLDACVLLGTEKPDLLVLDLNMPGMDGLGVGRAIKNNNDLANTNVLLVTGFPGDQRVMELQKIGFDKVLPKPFEPQELRDQVDNIFNVN